MGDTKHEQGQTPGTPQADREELGRKPETWGARTELLPWLLTGSVVLLALVAFLLAIGRAAANPRTDDAESWLTTSA